MQWVETNDVEQSVYTWLRSDPHGGARPVLVVINATPTPQRGYRVGVPAAGRWAELVNSDAERYGGSGVGNLGAVESEPTPSQGFDQSIVLAVPPLAAVFFAPDA